MTPLKEWLNVDSATSFVMIDWYKVLPIELHQAFRELLKKFTNS